MIEISKELLSEVLHCDVYKIDIKDNALEYDCDFDDVPIVRIINIYELANKCIEWANKKSYTVIDYIDINNDEFWTCRAYPNGLNDGFDYEAIYQPLSPISIFDVCQWILDNKN